jgi:hypothetical protein
MEKEIRFRVKKDLDSKQHKNILALKGSLIAQRYTDIIHISDEDEDYHINSFSVVPEQKATILHYITLYLKEKGLDQAVTIIQAVGKLN